MDETKNYICLKCKANIVTDMDLKQCIYCNKKLEEDISFKTNIRYDYILPLNRTKEEVITILKKFLFSKSLRPGIFNIKKQINNLCLLYVPVWLFDFDANGEVSFDCSKISKFKSKNNKYIKTDSYLVTLGGSMTFKNIPIYNSVKINEEIIDFLGGFDYSTLTKYKDIELKNFLIEETNLKLKNIISIGENNVKDMFVNKLKKEINEYENIEEINSLINLNNTDKKSFLLPIWTLPIKYKNKDYNIFINGQSGKVFGKIPISKSKLIFKFMISFLLVFIILFILFNYKVML